MPAPIFAWHPIRHRRALLAAGGILLLLAGAWLASSAYHATSETRAVEQVAPWTERAAFTYSVPVTRNATHWPLGTRLPMGEPAYFRTVSDSIDVDFAWAPDIPANARGVAAATMTMLVRAQTADGRPYWSVEHPLSETYADDARTGLALAGKVDLDALHAEAKALAEQLPPGEGIINWSVRVKVVYALELSGREEQRQVEYALVILANEPRYILPPAEALQWERTHAEERTLARTSAAGMSGVLRSGPALGLLGLGLAALVASALLAPPVGNGAFEREYRKYRDWVSVAGGIPDPALRSAPVVDVASLEDLVHVAADARTRVLLDAGTREFYALLPGVVYRYAGHATTPAAG